MKIYLGPSAQRSEDKQWKSETLALSFFEVFPQLQPAQLHKEWSGEIIAAVAHTVHCSLAALILLYAALATQSSHQPLMLSPGGLYQQVAGSMPP